jgi:hypothetical protein
MRVYVSMNYIAPSEDHACTPIILSENRIWDSSPASNFVNIMQAWLRADGYRHQYEA